MTHPVYSARFLSAKGLVVKLLPTAAIGFESESFESLTQPYIVILQGQIIERFGTYAQAERYCFGKYNIAIERPSHEAFCQIGNDCLPNDLEDDSVQSFEEYIEELVFDDSEDEVIIDDYLFHDNFRMERGSGRDKALYLVAV